MKRADILDDDGLRLAEFWCFTPAALRQRRIEFPDGFPVLGVCKLRDGSALNVWFQTLLHAARYVHDMAPCAVLAFCGEDEQEAGVYDVLHGTSGTSLQ